MHGEKKQRHTEIMEINDLTESLLNYIMFEIRVIQEKIIELRKIINI